MAMKKREPGFMGLAKQNARKEGMFQVPKRYQPQGGEEEYPAFVTQKEMAMLKQQGGSGHMTPYGVPSFNPNQEKAWEDLSPVLGLVRMVLLMQIIVLHY